MTRESADVERTRAFARNSLVGGLAGAVRLDFVTIKIGRNGRPSSEGWRLA